MTYTIRVGQADDLSALLDLRREAATWLSERGINQWTRDMTAVIRERLDAGDTWMLDTLDGTPIATITLMGPDLDFWSPSDDPDNASYVYKLMVRRSHAGKKVGDDLLDWAGDRAARKGLGFLRLDCDRNNTRLHTYYLARGFSHLRTVYRPHRQSGALFQRPARRIELPVFRERNGEFAAG